MIKTPARSLAQLAKNLRYAVHKVLERYHDWRLGVFTDAEIHLPQVGIHDSDCHCYAATNYRRFKQVLDAIDVNPEREGIIDYGSGLGRVVILAARYPFKRVIGLEVSEQLHTRALKNIDTTRTSFQCNSVELVNADARTYSLPAEITVLYFWNPFNEKILRAVCLQLQASLRSNPRQVTVCYASPYRPNCLDLVIEEFPWLRLRKTLSLGSSMHITIADAGPIESLK